MIVKQSPLFHASANWATPFLVALVTGAAGSVACSQAPSSAPAQQTATPASQPETIPRADRPPFELAQVGESATSLFDAAVASDWNTAQELIQELKHAASSLPNAMPKPDIVAQLRTRLRWLGDHVADKQRVETMDDANAITRFVADLSAEYQTYVPYEVVMLGYYGRQLELGIAAGQVQTLKKASTDLRSTWNRVQPSLERRGHIDDARRFTDIVVDLEGARRPAQFVAPTRAELAEADHIAKMFRSPS